MKWPEIDSRLEALGKDRRWLADVAPYTYDTIRNTMAPNSPKKTDRMLSVLSRAIEDEEARQSGAEKVRLIQEVRPGVYEIFRNDDERHRSDLASRIVGSPSLADYCHDVIVSNTDRILGKHSQTLRVAGLIIRLSISPGIRVGVSIS